MFFLILIPWSDLFNEGSKHKRSFLVVLEYSTSFTFRSPTTDNNFQLLIYLLISIFSSVNFAYLTFLIPSFLQWTEWMIGLLDWETVDYLWSRLCCSRHLPFWLRYFEGLKFLRPFTLTRPLGHGLKMEFWKMSGNLLKYKKWGGGGGGWGWR